MFSPSYCSNFGARAGSLWPAALRSRARIADYMVHHKPVPDEQNYHCSNGRTDKTRALIELIPANGLANKSCNKCTDDPEDCGENKA